MVKTVKYINDYLFFVARPDDSRVRGALLLCGGVNMYRFLPLTRGRHGLASNPASRGLALTLLGVRELALSKGILPKTIRGNDCAGLATTKDDYWHTNLLLIENPTPAFSDEVVEYSVMSFLQRFFKATMIDTPLPAKLPSPGELQAFLDEQSRVHGRATR